MGRWMRGQRARRGAVMVEFLFVFPLLLLLMMISLTIVVSLRAVGNILVVAMLVTPAATARLLTERLPYLMALGAASAARAGCAAPVFAAAAPAAQTSPKHTRTATFRSVFIVLL